VKLRALAVSVLVLFLATTVAAVTDPGYGDVDARGASKGARNGPARLSVVRDSAHLVMEESFFFKLNLVMPVKWVKTYDSTTGSWAFRVTGSSADGHSLHLNGTWKPVLGGGYCTASIPAWCALWGDGPVELRGVHRQKLHVTSYESELALVGTARDGYCTYDGKVVGCA
jgi:hypothetical protein